jgi:anti-sigma factor RsiW
MSIGSTVPGDDELHAYVDDRLEPARRSEIEAYLAEHSVAAAQVAAWRGDAQALRASLAGMLTLPVDPALDPRTIRRQLRQRSRRRLALCAALLLTLGFGGVAGWQTRNASYALAHPPMADALQAYRLFATDSVRPVEMDASDAGRLQSWLSSRLGRPLALPNLSTYGFALLGGRLLSTAEGPAALLMYQDPHGQRISFYVRPSTRFAAGYSGSRENDGLLARYWFRNGYGFAVVGRAADPRTHEVQNALPETI